MYEMSIEQRNGGASTAVMEAPIELQSAVLKQDNPVISTTSHSSIGGRSLNDEADSQDRNETLPSPSIASAEQVENWNSPRKNLYRFPAVLWAFAVMGMNDAAYGAIIPYLEEYYQLSYTIISLIFLSPFVGYTLAALVNNAVHMRFGQRGVAFLGPVCHLIAYVIIAVHPPYPVLIIAYMIAGLGNGIEDSGWNAWVGAMANANELLGILHGLYGAGAVVAPLIATTMIASAGLPWYYWYYVMIAAAALELGTSMSAFWTADAVAFRASHPRTSEAAGSRLREAVARMPAARTTWIAALFLLGYVGAEVALGGWIVVFMMDVRKGAAFASGMVATGFWLGITVGRVILGFVTPRIGEKLAIMIYLPISAGLQLLFWLVPQFYVSAVAVSLQGFFLGPLFPAAVVVMTRLLPKHLHVSAIGFAAAFGGSGGAIFPFAVGALAQAKGVQVLQPIILALLVVIWLLWCGLPRTGKKKE
jgi:fucose permease